MQCLAATRPAWVRRSQQTLIFSATVPCHHFHPLKFITNKSKRYLDLIQLIIIIHNRTILAFHCYQSEFLCNFRHSDAIQCLAYNPVTHQLASCAVTDFGKLFLIHRFLYFSFKNYVEVDQ